MVDMKNRILIVTHSHDLHADLAVPMLERRGCTPLRLDLDAFPRERQSPAQPARQHLGLLPHWRRPEERYGFRAVMFLPEGARRHRELVRCEKRRSGVKLYHSSFI